MPKGQSTAFTPVINGVHDLLSKIKKADPANLPAHISKYPTTLGDIANDMRTLAAELVVSANKLHPASAPQASPKPGTAQK